MKALAIIVDGGEGEQVRPSESRSMVQDPRRWKNEMGVGRASRFFRAPLRGFLVMFLQSVRKQGIPFPEALPDVCIERGTMVVGRWNQA